MKEEQDFKEKEINKTNEENSDLKEQKKTEDSETSKINEEKINPEDKLIELEDKLARAFAEMENQRRRYEKEKEDAFEYGGFTFAKEALGIIDNLDRSKQILESDESLKNTEALKKTLEHLDIIYKDLLSIFF